MRRSKVRLVRAPIAIASSLLVAHLVVACSSSEPSAGLAETPQATTVEPVPEQARNAIVIVVDGLHADHVTADRMPTLDRLARGGTRGQLRSTIPRCLPAVASLLTGVSPERLGFPTSSPGGDDLTLPGVAWTLPEILRCEAFRTAAFSANGYVSDWKGVEQGFEVVENALLAQTDTRASALFERAATWISRHRQSRWFAYVHLMELYAPDDPLAAARIVDAALGDFMQRLGGEGLLAETLVVVVADFGGVHGSAADEGESRPPSPTPETAAVPFVAMGRGHPRVIPPNATLANVAPTILEALGIDLPERFEAPSLGPEGLRPPTASVAVEYPAEPVTMDRDTCLQLAQLGYLIEDPHCEQYPTLEEIRRGRSRGPNAPCALEMP